MTAFRVLKRRDPGYPAFLAAIHDPPPSLWLRGSADPELLSRPSVALVGARACSSYGRAVARSLGREIAAAGVVVISGMARGIDGEAHRGALDAGGTTVAVLGCGIDRSYPAAHAELAGKIVERGLVVSEYEPGVEPAPWRFPARKRKYRMGIGMWLETVAVSAVDSRERAAGVVPVWFGRRTVESGGRRCAPAAVAPHPERSLARRPTVFFYFCHAFLSRVPLGGRSIRPWGRHRRSSRSHTSGHGGFVQTKREDPHRCRSERRTTSTGFVSSTPGR